MSGDGMKRWPKLLLSLAKRSGANTVEFFQAFEAEKHLYLKSRRCRKDFHMIRQSGPRLSFFIPVFLSFPFWLCVCVSRRLAGWLAAYLPVCQSLCRRKDFQMDFTFLYSSLSVYLSLSGCVCMCVCVQTSVYLATCLPGCLFVSLSVTQCLSVCYSVSLSLSLSHPTSVVYLCLGAGTQHFKVSTLITLENVLYE